MEVTVECYAGHRGEETPRRLRFDSRSVAVAEILNWIEDQKRAVEARRRGRAGVRARRARPTPGAVT